MQNLVLFSALAFLSVIAGPPNAQNKTAATGGLYLTANDFEQQKLSYAIDSSSGGDKIKANEFLGSAKGYVISKGEKHEFSKKEVYGYRNCKN